MTERESKVIRNYLLKADVVEIEFYEELFDHMASSFENRRDLNETIERHLESVVASSFGGSDGVEEMVLTQKRLRRSKIYRQTFKLFVSFFTTKIGLVKSLLLFSILYFLGRFYDAKVLSTISTIVFLLAPVTAYIMQWDFRIKCKKNKLPYKTSFTNKTIFLISIMLLGLSQGIPDILSRIISGNRFNTLNYLTQFQYLILPITFLIIIYTWVCLSLIQHRVRIKLSSE